MYVKTCHFYIFLVLCLFCNAHGVSYYYLPHWNPHPDVPSYLLCFFFCNATCHTMIGWETWKAEVAWVYSCWCWRAKCLNWPYYLQYLYVLLKICVHSLTFMLRHLIIQHLTIWCIFLSIGLPSVNLPRYYNYDVHDTTIFSHHLSYDGGKLCA